MAHLKTHLPNADTTGTIIYCLKHKIADMISLHHSTLCQYAECITRASFNIPDSPPVFCSKHKNMDIVILVIL